MYLETGNPEFSPLPFAGWPETASTREATEDKPDEVEAFEEASSSKSLPFIRIRCNLLSLRVNSAGESTAMGYAFEKMKDWEQQYIITIKEEVNMATYGLKKHIRCLFKWSIKKALEEHDDGSIFFVS